MVVWSKGNVSADNEKCLTLEFTELVVAFIVGKREISTGLDLPETQTRKYRGGSQLVVVQKRIKSSIPTWSTGYLSHTQAETVVGQVSLVFRGV